MNPNKIRQSIKTYYVRAHDTAKELLPMITNRRVQLPQQYIIDI